MENITHDTGVAEGNHNCHIVDIDRYPGINIQANDVIKRLPTSKSCLIEISQENQMESIIVHSKREIHLIKLAHIISESNAPVGMYDKIIKWAKDLDEDDLNRTISFKTLIRQTAKRYGMSNIFPESFQVILPSLNAVKVTKFNFAAQLYSLLGDEELMREENLIYGKDMYFREDSPPDLYIWLRN